jgi:hypothetical protein
VTLLGDAAHPMSPFKVILPPALCCACGVKQVCVLFIIQLAPTRCN